MAGVGAEVANVMGRDAQGEISVKGGSRLILVSAGSSRDGPVGLPASSGAARLERVVDSVELDWAIRLAPHRSP